MDTKTIFVNELPGTDLVLFHEVGSHCSEVLTKEEAVTRGVNEFLKGNHVTGPASACILQKVIDQTD
jgi:hypothetical protein